MTGNEFQKLAARTINKNLVPAEMRLHALHGLASEVGELHGLYQKRYQGHHCAEEYLKKECSDILWFIAEYCTAQGWELDEIMQLNIDKLMKRYPDGFEEAKSLNRAKGDV